MLPSLNAIAVPDAFVNDCARCAITAKSSGEPPRVLVLLPASETCVAMVYAVLKELFGKCLGTHILAARLRNND